MPPVITSVANVVPADGKRLVVTLQAAPVGALSFYASRVPGAKEIGPLAKEGGPLAYTVTVRQAATQNRVLYYVTATDDGGDSAQGCEWLCQGTSKGVSQQVEEWLQGVLRDNRAGLARAVEHAVGAQWPDGRPVLVERILRGLPGVGSGGAYPVVGVRVAHVPMEWYAMEMGYALDMSAEVYCYAVHQLNVPWERAIRALAEGVMDVLNQRQYLEPALPCGLELRDCRARSLAVEHEEWAGDHWVTGARLTWGGVLETAYPL